MSWERQIMPLAAQDIFLLVSDFNLAGQRFYAAHGYHQVGTVVDDVCLGIGELIYRKRLREGEQ
jgi:hypothetical protein